MKKILIILLSCFLLISCEPRHRQIKIRYDTQQENVDNVIKESDFKCVRIGESDGMIFYKVFVTQKSPNGKFVHEYLVTKYNMYNVSVQEITCYNDSLNNFK